MLSKDTHNSLPGVPAAAGPRDVAAAFLNALAAREFTGAQSLLAQGIQFRMLVPGRLMTDQGANATIRRFASWFAGPTSSRWRPPAFRRSKAVRW
ncbi:hypothetical protein AHiyo4_41850 [Arthrobacter sp. Hiyo4]|nr:hypothetical protein AHiyo4_41850 [Arthrobacter sp. Hiyo4]